VKRSARIRGEKNMEKSRKIVILNPVGEAEILKFNLAPRPNHIEGKTIGLLDNLKPNANVILDRASRGLVDKFSSVKVVAKSKPIQAAPIPEGIIREFSEKCDLVINALSD
jgi:hypothetical protein